MRRHFTATAFVVHEGRTLLHWHRKLGQWMPPGGHLLPAEDPATGALREVREETGLGVELLPLTPVFDFAYPRQLPAPHTVLVEDSPEAGEPHQHIDFIYFSRSLDDDAARPPTGDDTLVWVSEAQLDANEPLPFEGAPVPVPADVRALALAAIRLERDLRSSSAGE